MTVREETIEVLAALEHEQWVEWAQTFMREPLSLSRARIKGWDRYFVPYAQLDETAKEQDRVWARRSLAALEAAGLAVHRIAGPQIGEQPKPPPPEPVAKVVPMPVRTDGSGDKHLCGTEWAISSGPGRYVGAIARSLAGTSVPLPTGFEFRYCPKCGVRDMTPELEQRFLTIEAAGLGR